MINKKILCIHQGFELYGSDRMFIYAVRALISKYGNQNVTVLLPKKETLFDRLSSLACDIRVQKIGAIRKSELRRLNLSAIWEIFKIRSKVHLLNQYDIIYINSVVILSFIVASFFSKRQTIIHIHEVPEGLTKILFKLLTARFKGKIICVSNTVRRIFENNKSKCITLYNGIEGFNFSELEKDQQGLRILLIGRISRSKGQYILLRALKELSDQQFEKIQVKIVGSVFEKEIHFKEEIIRIVESDSRLQNIVEISNFVEFPESFFEWSNLVVIPSTFPEPFGLVALEAMSKGRAIIAADHGGLSEIIVESVNGLKFEPKDHVELSSKIGYLLERRELLSLMGKKGRKLFEENYKLQKFQDRFITIFESVI